MRIAIIGMGIAGGSTLRALYEQKAVRPHDEIHVYEDRQALGVGLPYQPDDERLLLNSFSQAVSLNADDPDDYVKFLERHYPGRFKTYEFTPRMIFGEYAQTLFLPYLKQKEVKLIRERVTSVVPFPETADSKQVTYRLQTAKGSSDYDAVFLACGHPPYADYYGLKGQPGYIHEPFPVSTLLNQIDPNCDRVGIVGSSLTALDVMEYLQENAEWRYPITFFTRHEPFATVKDQLYEGDEVVFSLDETWLAQNRDAAGQITLQAALDQMQQDFTWSGIDLSYILENYQSGSLGEIKQQLQQTDEQLLKFQYYIAVLSEHLTALVHALEMGDRNEFFEKYRPWYEYFHVQLPRVKMQKIWDWYLAGKVRFVRDLKTITPRAKRGVVVKTAAQRTYQADVLVNATGFETRLVEATKVDPLIQSLFAADLLMPSPQQDVAITWPGSQPISRTYGVAPNLYMSGFWIGSTQYPNNNVQRTAQQGERMVASFKKNNLR